MSNGSDELTAAARRCWKLLETLHVCVYFAPEPAKEYEALGLDAGSGYFASRAAPLGRVPAEVVTATFYTFSPDLVARAIPAAWDIAPPEDILAARHRGVAAVLARVFAGTDDAPAREAVALLRTVTGGFTTAGRPLYAAHAALDWPDDPWLALWHASALVREHRGDGHIAALLAAGIPPVDASITGGVAAGLLEFNRKTRGWPAEQWSAATQRLIDEGVLADENELAPAGRELRARIEERTDAGATEGWSAIGVDGAARLDELLSPLLRTYLKSGVLPESVSRSKSG